MVCYVSVESLSLKFHNSAQPCVDDQNARELRLFIVVVCFGSQFFRTVTHLSIILLPNSITRSVNPTTHPRILGSTNKACREEEKSNGQVVRLSKFCNSNEKSLQ